MVAGAVNNMMNAIGTGFTNTFTVKKEDGSSTWNKTTVSIGATAVLMGATVAAMACRYGLSKDAMLKGLSQDMVAFQNLAQPYMDCAVNSNAYKFAATSLSNLKDKASTGLSSAISGASEALDNAGFYAAVASAKNEVISGADFLSKELSAGVASARGALVEGLEKVGFFDQLSSVQEQAVKTAGKIQDYVASGSPAMQALKEEVATLTAQLDQQAYNNSFVYGQ